MSALSTDEPYADDNEPDEPQKVAQNPDEYQWRPTRDGEVCRPGQDEQAAAHHAEQPLPRPYQPAGVGGQRRADEGRPERGQREREDRGMELPHQREGRVRLGQAACGDHDRDLRGNEEGK